MELLLIILYSFFIVFIFSYSLIQLHLVWLYRKYQKKAASGPDFSRNPDFVPMVTVQLPIYNELYVVERLIRSVAAFDWPQDRLEIQILDDSNDATVDIIAREVAHFQKEGFAIQHVRRDNRQGFKAGALAYGTALAQGDYIAIFDADFIPRPDFLQKTIPYFQDPEIGVVQTRWEHLNEGYSLLTKLQAFALDAHFTIEQTGRNHGHHFINFNGTAGVWRKDCIQEAGGWQSDTLTEDLDLSYRAQLKGWKFKYLMEVGTPAELPVAVNAMKTQQFRWTKGAAECTRKNLGRVLRARGLDLGTKLHAIFHLMNSFVFVCVAAISLLSIPILWIKNSFPEYRLLFQYGSVFLVSMLFLSYYYWNSYSLEEKKRPFRIFHFIKRFLLFLAISMGFSLHNALAVIEGYIGRKTPFVRTPKFNVRQKTDTWQGNIYLRYRVGILTWVEGLLALYFIGGIVLGFYLEDYGLMPFHLLLSFGFGYIFFYTFYHAHVAQG